MLLLVVYILWILFLLSGLGNLCRILHFDLEKKNSEILAALQYKPLYNIIRSENGLKEIEAAAYNGAHTVFGL
jgi:hypothetical protein